MSEESIKIMAIKLEQQVKDNPYLMVPETGPKAGVFGINYEAFVRAVLENFN